MGGQIGEAALLRAENKQLLAEVTRLHGQALTEERVRREIFRLAEAQPHVPDWLCRRTTDPGCYGVPTLMLSDQHLGEVVNPSEIGGVNEYNLTIARRRWQRVTEKTVDLCFSFLARPKFDGIVLAVAGDGVSGDIHEELADTNEAKNMPLALELADLTTWTVRELLRAFQRVFVVCVPGNHGRTSKKPRAKRAAHTSFDWLANQVTARMLQGAQGVTILAPAAEDVAWKIYGHRYCMTHGAQFRGGDGIIGPIGPIFRGDSKKRARNAQVGQAYDTLLIGHFHQLAQDARIIRNGSLKGYDEFAWKNQFPFERPQQALWITHPTSGITFSFPVFAEEPSDGEKAPWVSWPAQQ